MTTTTETRQALPTNNEEWGFWGTTLRNLEGEGGNLILQGDSEATAAEATADLWADAQGLLVAEGLTPAQARDFLDSRAGRHFADAWTSEAFCFYSHDTEAAQYDLDRVGGLPAWVKKDARMAAKGLHRVTNSYGRTVWVRIPK